jgi:hypothetical protein
MIIIFFNIKMHYKYLHIYIKLQSTSKLGLVINQLLLLSSLKNGKATAILQSPRTIHPKKKKKSHFQHCIEINIQVVVAITRVVG